MRGTHRSLNGTVLVAPAWHRRTSKPHILRAGPAGEPVDRGLCGTETFLPGDADRVRVGDHATKLCQRCFGFYLHHFDEDRMPYMLSGQHDD